MFIDDINHSYHYLNDSKSIVWENEKRRFTIPDGVSLDIRPDMYQVLDKLLRERPTWRFKSDQRVYVGNGQTNVFINTFHIYDGDEQLGKLWYESHWRDSTTRYYFNNHRLAETRQRGNGNFTTKPQVAIKNILKAFHTLSPSERASRAFAEARSAVGNKANAHGYEIRRAVDAIKDELIAYAVNNWETVSAALADPAKHSKLPSLVETSHEMDQMHARFNAGQGALVRVEHNGAYLVARTDNSTYDTKIVQDSMLSDHMRGALGLLKLVDDNTYIGDVGYRVKANLFFIEDRTSNG